MGPSTEQRATAAGDDSVRRRGAEESGRLGAGVLPGMEESADRLAARCAAGNGRDDAAGSGAIAAHSNGIVRKDFPNAVQRKAGSSFRWLTPRDDVQGVLFTVEHGTAPARGLTPQALTPEELRAACPELAKWY